MATTEEDYRFFMVKGHRKCLAEWGLDKAFLSLDVVAVAYEKCQILMIGLYNKYWGDHTSFNILIFIATLEMFGDVHGETKEANNDQEEEGSSLMRTLYLAEENEEHTT
ncbi:hypothetical protein ACJX0J_007933, partial [Zea mays]